MVSARTLIVEMPLTSERLWVKNGIRPPAQRDQFALAGVAALADDGLHGGGGDVVVPRWASAIFCLSDFR
jgi:hypothetical protein